MSFEMSATSSPFAIAEALAGAAYEPEDVALLDTAFTRACQEASQRLALGDGIRSLLPSPSLKGRNPGCAIPNTSPRSPCAPCRVSARRNRAARSFPLDEAQEKGPLARPFQCTPEEKGAQNL